MVYTMHSRPKQTNNTNKWFNRTIRNLISFIVLLASSSLASATTISTGVSSAGVPNHLRRHHFLGIIRSNSRQKEFSKSSSTDPFFRSTLSQKKSVISFVSIPATQQNVRKTSTVSKQKKDLIRSSDFAPVHVPRGGGQSDRISSMKNSPSEIVSIFDNGPFLQYNSIIGVINLLGMMISLLFPGVQYHLDLLGTGAFAMASLASLVSVSLANSSVSVAMTPEVMDLTRTNISSIAVILWSVKLASFLFYRACNVKTDARLDSLLSTVPGVVAFWTLSFLWGVVSSLPHSLGLTSTIQGNNGALLTGVIVFATGFLMESTADYQKWVFKKQNPGKFCNVGLWSVSQHPNFFGSFLIWTAIFIMNAPALIQPFDDPISFASILDQDTILGAVKSALTNFSAILWSLRRVFYAFLSPAFLWMFFSGQAEGTIGAGVEQSFLRYGDDPKFREYVENVPLIVPDLKKCFFGAGLKS